MALVTKVAPCTFIVFILHTTSTTDTYIDVAHILLLFTFKYYHFSHRYFIRYVMPYSFNRNQAKPFFLLLCAGIFRVPGDEIELNLAKIRLQNAKKVCTYTFDTCALHLSARNNTFCTYTSNDFFSLFFSCIRATTAASPCLKTETTCL